MSMDRRQFLRGAAVGGAAAAATGGSADADAAILVREPKPLPPKAVGMLYDSTLCVGCKACVAACKEANVDYGAEVERPAKLAEWNTGTWDTAEDLSGHTFNVIRVFTDGTMETKDAAANGFAFIKRHCLHCVDASCVSVCPVSAMKKHPETGIVSHDPDACIGCRYCVYGCPFGVPQYQFDEAFGQIGKCQFCYHLQEQGQIPACCDVCPTGASLFGLVEDLQAEAERRLAAAPGEMYEFARGRLGSDRPTHVAALGQYQTGVYGETEVGGTQVRYLAGVPFDKLGLPTLDKTSYAAISEGVQHTIYQGMIAPFVLLVGLMGFAWRSARRAEDDEDRQEEPR